MIIINVLKERIFGAVRIFVWNKKLYLNIKNEKTFDTVC